MHREYFSKKQRTYQQVLLPYLMEKNMQMPQCRLTVPLFFVYNDG